jgi:hypothetical protein
MVAYFEESCRHTASADALVWGTVLLEAAVLCLPVSFMRSKEVVVSLTSGLVLGVRHVDDMCLKLEVVG